MAILHSHRNAIVYLEHTKITRKNEQVVYSKAVDSVELFFTIPFANTSSMLLGPGTSITSSAMQLLAGEGVLIGFVGGGGVPIWAGSLSEYRPTEYCQKWIINWQQDKWKLSVAKHFQKRRTELVEELWNVNFKNEFKNELLIYSSNLINGLNKSSTKTEILGYEANYAKSLYALLAKKYNVSSFRRVPSEKIDYINELIDTHNYYAYAIAGIVLWTLGIPFAFPVLHGDTRRGALIFDLADIIKDAYLLPLAFDANHNCRDKSEYKKICVDILNTKKVMQLLFNEIKDVLDDERFSNE